MLYVYHAVSKVRKERKTYARVAGNSLKRITVSTEQDQSRVFIPSDWDPTQVFRELDVVQRAQNTGILGAEALSRCLIWQLQGMGVLHTVSSWKQTVSTKAKWLASPKESSAQTGS